MKDLTIRRGYQGVLSKTHSDILAIPLYRAVCAFFRAGSPFVRKQPVSMTAEEARSILQTEYPKPEPGKGNVVTTDEVRCDLSVIIPAYKAEATLEACLHSVLDQTADLRLEVILINDGSPDGSLMIAQKLQQDYPQLVIIDQPNGGAASARNAGLNQAAGRYVMFVDADDELMPGAIRALMIEADASSADIVQGSWKYTGGSEQRYPCAALTDDSVPELMGVPWGKVYRRSLFDGIRYPLHYTSFEDSIIKCLVMEKAAVIRTIPDCVYSWLRNPTGITTSSKRSSRSVQAYWILEEMNDEHRLLGLPDDRKHTLIALQQLSVMYSRSTALSEDVRKAMFRCACELLSETAGSYSGPLPFPYRLMRKALLDRDYALYSHVGKRWSFL